MTGVSACEGRRTERKWAERENQVASCVSYFPRVSVMWCIVQDSLPLSSTDSSVTHCGIGAVCCCAPQSARLYTAALRQYVWQPAAGRVSASEHERRMICSVYLSGPPGSSHLAAGQALHLFVIWWVKLIHTQWCVVMGLLCQVLLWAAIHHFYFSKNWLILHLAAVLRNANMLYYWPSLMMSFALINRFLLWDVVLTKL